VTVDAAVRFTDAFLEPILDGANHAFEKGTISAVVTAGEDEDVLLVKVLVGLSRLREGRILVLEQDLGALSRVGLDEIRRRVGIVYPNGGLISNLKVLENVTLPLLYHSAMRSRDIERRAVATLERLGCGEDLFSLPGGLSTFKRRMTGFARVVAMEPEVVVYDRLADGLHEEERDVFLRMALEFHEEMPGRTTIFLTSNPTPIAGAGPLTVVYLTKGHFE
jgi:phospholipid/cholesterol/gamma-HCH transport system ATP-binding protein